MFNNPKHVFWQAFLAAAIIFAFGIWMGFLLENYRTSKAGIMFSKDEVDLMDIRLQSELYKNHDLEVECTSAVEENMKFGDRIYEEGKIFDQQKKANELTEDIIYQHKKLDLLRVTFWLNSIYIKNKCNSTYHNVVYFYQFKNPEMDKKAEQGVVSEVLTNLKEKYGSNVVLIPLAADNNITSITLLREYYNVTYLPTILIDEEHKIQGTTSLKDIERVFED
jgi:hypothetical protein